MVSERIVVVKIGGSEGIDLDAFCEDVSGLSRAGLSLVIVHGGSHQTSVLGEQLGHPPRFIQSPGGHVSRRTDRRTLEIFQMACRGLLNQRIVAGLQARGVNALGLSGIDGRLWEGERKGAVRAVVDGRTTLIRDDFTGTVDRVNGGLLRSLLGAGCVPVISPPGISTRHEPINVDADRGAAMTAAALGADQLLLLSNVPGLLREFPDERTLVRHVARAEVAGAAAWARGRMKKKVMGAEQALRAGVRRVVIGDGRGVGSVWRAFAGEGTVFE